MVFGIDEEYDPRNFGEVVFPETAGCCLVSSEFYDATLEICIPC